jgi:hypothetical protein
MQLKIIEAKKKPSHVWRGFLGADLTCMCYRIVMNLNTGDGYTLNASTVRLNPSITITVGP